MFTFFFKREFPKIPRASSIDQDLVKSLVGVACSCHALEVRVLALRAIRQEEDQQYIKLIRFLPMYYDSNIFLSSRILRKLDLLTFL